MLRHSLQKGTYRYRIALNNENLKNIEFHLLSVIVIDSFFTEILNFEKI